jgi:E3 ubiquitin-protein ligase RNF8
LAEKDKEVQALRQLLANKDKIQAEVEENKANEIEDQKHAIALAAVLADKEQLRAELLAKESTMQELAQKLAESEAAGKVLQEMLDQQATERAEERATLKELKEQLKMHREQSETKIDKSAVEEELTCSICQELLCDAQTLDCSHSFCAECLAQWRKHKQVRQILYINLRFA